MTGAAIVGVAFWVFVTVAAVAGIVSDYKRRRLEIEPLRAAIERGQTLDPAVLERLLARPSQDAGSVNSLHVRIGGILTLAAGVGIALMSLFVRSLAPRAFLPLIGGGLLVLCVGVGLLVAARAIEQHRRRAPDPVA